jgi:hypothetical protein
LTLQRKLQWRDAQWSQCWNTVEPNTDSDPEAAVKFLADDDRFGIIITPTEYRQMYEFRLVLGGRLVGDAEPCIIGTAMLTLGDLKELDDRRLSPDPSGYAALVRLLETDEELHDATTLSISESLDNWQLHAYRHEGRVFFVAREYQARETSGELIIVAVEQAIYDPLFEMSHIYWTKCETNYWRLRYYSNRYCYVAVTLSGHREPTPILRLRWQGSPDQWTTGIYKASTGQYSENELPASFGPLTGTPEQE